ncbi:MAG TPA: MASE4 domain-containing protein [Steroidobacteraceae bacterium]|nr:MASE4 domain-containing protein [Steroidobacteraceae bacterium]
MVSSTPDQLLLPSTLPPGRTQIRVCAAVAIVLLAASLATIPFATLQLPQMQGFIPVVDTVLVLGDLITASLLFAQFSVLRSRALLVLASGYLFTGLVMIPHALTFPGAFSETGLLGAGVNTTIWLYYFWHSGLPVAVIGYALSKEGAYDTATRASTRRAVVVSVAGVPALVIGLTVLTTAGHSLLPSMMSDALTWSPQRLRIVASVLFALLGGAMWLLWRGRRSMLSVWLLVSLWAWLIELVMVTFTSTRFSLLWFAGRLYGMLSGVFVLLMLLWETNRLYSQLALTAATRRSEREGRLATLEALSAAIDHQIRQPLGAIVANANAGRRWLARTPPECEEAREAFDAISADGHRSAEVIRSVRAIFSRREQQQVLVDLNDLLTETIALLRDELHSLEIAVELSLQRLPPVVVDPGQVQQVILNLVHNAADAMRAPRERAAVLRVSSQPHGAAGVQVTIADSGAGIDPGIADRVFDPFFTTKPNGMGMGLAVCRSIVEEHGGSLVTVPAIPCGAEFRILLPGGVG